MTAFLVAVAVVGWLLVVLLARMASKGRQELRELFFTPQRAGLFHWMHLAARGGGGQADMLADQGSCAGVFASAFSSGPSKG